MLTIRIIISMFVLVTIVGQVACAGNSAIELLLGTLPNPASQSIPTKIEGAVVQRFAQLNPDIVLKRGTSLNIEGPSNSMDMVPLMQIAGDISPDVLFVNFRLSDTYIQKGFLRPLDDFMRSMPKRELDRRVPPSVRDVCYRYGPDGRKHWYALPTTKLVRVLVYRRDMFAEAGIDPDSPPRTWSQFYDYAKRLSSPGKGKYGMVFAKGDATGWDFANLVWSRGGDIVGLNKNGKWEPKFNTPEVLDALYYYVRLNCTRWKGPDGKWYRGVAARDLDISIVQPGSPYAMAFSYLDQRMNEFQPDLIGYAPVPYPDGAKHGASEINCPMLGVYSGVKDPRKIKAAFKYIAFLDSDEANRVRTKMFIQLGYGKLVNPEFLERFGYKDYLTQVDKSWVAVYKDALVNGKPEPYGKNCSGIYRELSRPIEQALNDPEALSEFARGNEKAVRERLKAILDRAQMETAKRMYDTLPGSVRKARHGLTLLFLALAVSGFGVATIYLVRTFRRNAAAQTPGQRKAFFAYCLLVPAAFTVLIWQYLPLIRGTMMAFQDYNVVGKSPFVGIENFSTVLFDASFWHSVYVTLIYTALYMAFAFISPIFLAMLLAEVPRGKILFRTIFYLPAVLSGLVVVFLWKSFYKPTGLLNALLGCIGIHPGVGWLDSPSLAMAAVILPVVWAGMGPGCLIYLAALKTIPEEFYEAAEVDGAGMIRKVTAITLPGLKMLILINAVGALIGAFMTSETILAMTGGGPYTPYGSTEVVGLQLFYTAFTYLKFGLANAMAWVLGFMLIGFMMFQLKNLSRVEFRGGR